MVKLTVSVEKLENSVKPGRCEKLGQLNSSQLALGDEVSIGRTIFRVVDYFTENYSLPLKQKIKMLVFFISHTCDE